MGNWFGVTSGNLIKHCGDTGAYTLAKALDGIDHWYHAVSEIHWFIIDLGKSCTISKMRGRSLSVMDPTRVALYTFQTPAEHEVLVGMTDAWRDTSAWVEVPTKPKIGRYIRVEIQQTEEPRDYIAFGSHTSPFTIFDVFTDVTPDDPKFSGDCGWKLVSLPYAGTISKTATYYLYNGTYYTFEQASTNDNETGAPLILSFLYGWDYPGQEYTLADDFAGYCGYWQYYYKDCQLYYSRAPPKAMAAAHFLYGLQPARIVKFGRIGL